MECLGTVKVVAQEEVKRGCLYLRKKKLDGMSQMSKNTSKAKKAKKNKKGEAVLLHRRV